jgi:hypothetical protein
MRFDLCGLPAEGSTDKRWTARLQYNILYNIAFFGGRAATPGLGPFPL